MDDTKLLEKLKRVTKYYCFVCRDWHNEKEIENHKMDGVFESFVSISDYHDEFERAEKAEEKAKQLVDCILSVEGLLELWHEDKIDLQDLLGRLDDVIHAPKIMEALIQKNGD